MAGTPTTNYNIPTYADTDAPDLSGAYNDAMGIIDTQLKANADAIESASTGNYTGTAPITVDNEGRTIGIQYAAVNEEGAPVTRGAVDVTGVSNNITSSSALNGTKVPNLRAVADYVAAHGGTTYTAGAGITISDNAISANIATINEGGQATAPGRVNVYGNTGIIANATEEYISSPNVPNGYAVKQYVESQMAAAGVAYTGTAPVVVDNGSHTISLAPGIQVNASASNDFVEATATDRQAYLTPVYSVADIEAYNDIIGNNNVEHDWPARLTAPTCNVVRYAIANATPNASTTVKGLVQLTDTVSFPDTTKALTGKSLQNHYTNMRSNATSAVTVGDLAKNLYYAPSTGMVFYKPTA